MKLEQVDVKNYRTLEDISIKFNGYYTAISGQNNAGKTSLIKVIRYLFRDNTHEYYFYRREVEINYRDDKTQWVTGNPDIEFIYQLSVHPEQDPGLFQFIEKFSEEKLPLNATTLVIRILHKLKDESECIASINNKELTGFASKEILQKLKSSNLAFMHDSASHVMPFYSTSGRYMHELMFSEDEIKQINDEQRKLQSKIKSISKPHKIELSELLGHLEEKYEVDFSIPDGMFSGPLPFAINLKDRNVDVPLNEWGSGTKNRTQIMMSILQANRIRSKDDENKITPFIIIEEPESFLHPSAQAEFGRVLMDLANQLNIQTIVTTHCPYMLCQHMPSSNILLTRKILRGKPKETELVQVANETWMEPFSKILGLDNSEFSAWKNILITDKKSVLLLEGEIDKQYFEYIQSLGIPGFSIPANVDIVAYEGKDALKNAILLKFFVERFKKVLVTFDLDAKADLERIMNQIGLIEGKNFLMVGANKPGRQCIEGLIPERILSKVYSSNTDLVMQLTSQDNKERKSAKNNLKAKILAEFKSDKSITADDLKLFLPIFRAIKKQLS